MRETLTDWPLGRSEMAGRIRTHDWGATPLGGVGGWPPSLSTMVSVILAARQPMWIGWGPGLIQLYNDAYAGQLDEERHPAILGRPAAEGWPELWPMVGSDIEAILGGGQAASHAHLPELQRSLGSARDPRPGASYSPIPDAAAPNGVGGVLSVAAEAGQAARLAEQQAIRNVLAVVRAMIHRTAETSETVADFAAHIDGRLAAMARTVTLLARSARAGVDLELMVREEFLAQAADEARISIAGPDVLLPPRAAEVLTLVLHELATNAMKYGALSAAGGRLRVRWRTTAKDGLTRLSLDWTETGVPVAALAPRRRGFGQEMIELHIADELKGSGSLDLAPGGLHARVEFPLSTIERDGSNPPSER
jgi:two-component sensor histidine kinase